MTTVTSFISFQNVGVREFELQRIQNESYRQTTAPVGIKTPLLYGGDSEGLFAMNFSFEDQVRDNLRNLVQTNHGDRVVHYDYGANLNELVTEFASMQKADFDSEVMIRINTAVSRFMPYVQLLGYSSRPIFEENEYVGKVGMAIKYIVPAISTTERILEVILYAI